MVPDLNIGVSPESRNTISARSASQSRAARTIIANRTPGEAQTAITPRLSNRSANKPHPWTAASRETRGDGEMPITELYLPVLSRFLCAVEMTTGLPPQPLDATPEQLQRVEQQENEKKALPKGVVLGPDGKPCRSCTSVSSWMAMARSAPASKDSKPNAVQTTTAPSTANASFPSMPSDCPPDVEQLGRSTWTLLHTMTAAYPERPTLTQQSETRQFISLFGKMYPCWSCADDFRSWMKDGNEPRVSNRDDFGRWMCEAHNAVNEKLGKKSFDCNKWEERWRTGWKDGRCG